MRKRFSLPGFITAFVFLLLYLPLMVLIINSFNDSRFGGEWSGLTLKWYRALWGHREIWNALFHSLIVAVSATSVSTVLGTLAAFALHHYKSRWQKIHYGLIYVPLAVPDILMGVSLLLFFALLPIPLGLFTIFIAHTTFCISYVTLTMVAKLSQFNFALIEAAQDLGANSWTTLRRVLIPALAPGIRAAALLAFTLSIDDFVVTFFVAGQGASTLPIYIYGMIKYGTTPLINALSTLILLVTIGTITAVYITTKEELT